MDWVGPWRGAGSPQFLGPGWGRRRRECAARVSEGAGACAPVCARRALAGEVRDSTTHYASPAVRRCGSRRALARTLDHPPPWPHRGAAGLGAPLRSRSFPGLLRLWLPARAERRVRLPGPDSTSGQSVAALSRLPSSSAQQSGGRGRPGTRSQRPLRVCRFGGGRQTGRGRGRACGFGPGAGQKRKRQMSLGIAALAPPVAGELWARWKAEERGFRAGGSQTLRRRPHCEAAKL